MRKTILSALIAILGSVLLSSCASKEGVDLSNEATLVGDAALRTCANAQDFFAIEAKEYLLRLAKAKRALREELAKLNRGEKEFNPTKAATLFVEFQKIRDEKTFRNRVVILDGTLPLLSFSACPRRVELRELRLAFEREGSASDADASRERKLFVSEISFRGKNNNFRIRPAGEKEPTSIEVFRRRLASLPERNQRESLFKLFNASRALRWQDWEVTDIIRERKEWAAEAKKPDYFSMILARRGIDPALYTEVSTRVRERIVPKLKELLTVWGTQAGISQIQVWDIAYLEERQTGMNFQPTLNTVADTAWQSGVLDGLSRVGLPRTGVSCDLSSKPGKVPTLTLSLLPATEAQRAEVQCTGAIKRPLGLTELAEIFDSLALTSQLLKWGDGSLSAWDPDPIVSRSLAYTMRSLYLQDAPLAGLPKDRTEWIQNNKRLRLIQIVNAYARSEMERQIYSSAAPAELAQDLAERWAKLFNETWGVELPAFYADWDFSELVTDPGEMAVRLMAMISSESCLGSWERNQVMTSLNDDFRTKLLPTLGEMGMGADARKISEVLCKERWSPDPFSHLLSAF